MTCPVRLREDAGVEPSAGEATQVLQSVRARQRQRRRLGQTATAVAGASGCLGLLGVAGASWLLIGGLLSLAGMAVSGWLGLRIQPPRTPEPNADIGTALNRLTGASASTFRWALVGAALLVPISLHLGAFLYLSGLSPISLVEPLLPGTGWARWLGRVMVFDWWIRLAVVFSGLAHFVLVRRCLTLVRRMETGHWVRSGFDEGLSAVGAATKAGLVPGIVFGGLPCFAILCTGLLFVPALFSWAATRHRRELVQLQQVRATTESRAGTVSLAPEPGLAVVEPAGA